MTDLQNQVIYPWQKQLERVERYYNRFKELNDGMPHCSNQEEYIDDVYAFFQNCYHLKDHLKNDPSYIKHNNTDIEDYVSDNEELAICADICNGSKHLVLRDGPRSGSTSKITGSSTTLEVGESTQISMTFEVAHNKRKLDAFQIATEALKKWKDFI